jgi:uncharacterized protein (DUF1778 family)
MDTRYRPSIRFMPEQAQRLQRAAKSQGLTKQAFILMASMKEVCNIEEEIRLRKSREHSPSLSERLGRYAEKAGKGLNGLEPVRFEPKKKPQPPTTQTIIINNIH